MEFFKAEELHKHLLETGEVRATGVVAAVPRQGINVLRPNTHAAERLLERGLTIEEAQRFIDNAKFVLKQQNGTVYAYYSEYGFAAVDTMGILHTAGYLDANGKRLFYEVVKLIG